jgi:hypothetical protein
VLLRRRRHPWYWTNSQLAAQVRATYRSRIDFVDEIGGEVHLTAVVFHQDRALLPRKSVKLADRDHGGFVPFCFYGIQWNEYLQTCVTMGDEPFDAFRTYSGHDAEAEARNAAKAWLKAEGDHRVRDIAFDELPPFARSMVFYVLRRGAGYFDL